MAATLEALEVGARVLLYDEQSSDPAFLTSDSRLQAFVGDKKNSLAARARQMVDELGISIVVSGSNLIAEYLPIADRVLPVKDFTLSDITAEVKEAGIESAAKASTVEMSECSVVHAGSCRALLIQALDRRMSILNMMRPGISYSALWSRYERPDAGCEY